ncbi:hypothetical protein D3C75_641180 [compost metagenome]
MAQPDDQGAGQKTDDAAAEGVDLAAENTFDNPGHQRDDHRQKQGAPETADVKAGHQPAGHNQYQRGYDKPDNGGQKIHG